MTTTGEYQPQLFEKTRFERFLSFYEDNPHVYEVFRSFALSAARRGVKVGARAVWERMRWHLDVETNGADYKLNDHYVPYYARLVMARHKSLADYFDTRDKRFDADSDILLRKANEIDRKRVCGGRRQAVMEVE